MKYALWRKYCKKYISLIRYGKSNKISEGIEKHHIFPQSIFGKNKLIVNLTPRQHFIAHKLLYKIFLFRNGENSNECFKMQKAFCWMQTRNCVKFNSRRYEFCKRMWSESMRGDKNPFHNSSCFSPEHRRKISESLLKNPPMKGKKHTEEARAKIKEKRRLQVFTKEQNEKRAKSVSKKIMTPAGIFESRKAASEFYKKDPACFNQFMKSRPKEYYYIKK